MHKALTVVVAAIMGLVALGPCARSGGRFPRHVAGYGVTRAARRSLWPKHASRGWRPIVKPSSSRGGEAPPTYGRSGRRRMAAEASTVGPPNSCCQQ